jgi:hypothetical protein
LNNLIIFISKLSFTSYLLLLRFVQKYVRIC